MITISILFIIAYSYSVYQIRKSSGSWKEFNPFNGNFFSYFGFMVGSIISIIAILTGILFVAYAGILP
jgi:hypothetical protein